MEVTHEQDRGEELLRVGDVAHLAQLSVDTIRRYADAGYLPSSRTPSGQRRFRRSDVEALLTSPALAESSPEADSTAAGGSSVRGDAA